MELGNWMFGNSRGEYPIPDRSVWQETYWDEFCEKVNCDGYGYFNSEHGYENEVFKVMPYDWDAECDCGYEDLLQVWCDNHKHSDSCLVLKYEHFEKQLEKEGIDFFHKNYEKEMKKLAKTVGVDGWEMWRFKCDCGVDEAFSKWSESNDHLNDCRLLKPNFLYKPTGFRINWYKYALRDSYMNQEITLKQFVEILRDCVKSYYVSKQKQES